MRKICIVTGTRAEWGLLSPIAAQLKEHPEVELQIVATNMHLQPLYGHTIDRIIDDGFEVTARVPMPEAGSSPLDTALATAACMAGMADTFATLTPDMIVILGDRTEMMATAMAAQIMRIPIAHLHGGEVSEGAIDDSIRHAITKLASLHLTSTESHRLRVMQLGEDPELVINTGAIGVYNALNVPQAPLEELTERIGFTPDSSTILVTNHPATMESPDDVERGFNSLLRALDRHRELKVIFTYPNNDANGLTIIKMIEQYAAGRPDSVRAIPSLGMRCYLSTLRHIAAVVGNSSSGIIEVPSMGIPTIDIGTRQQGRTAAESVIHTPADADSIDRALTLALSPQMRQKAAQCSNPYYRPDTLRLIVDALVDTPLDRLRHKSFHDITPS